MTIALSHSYRGPFEAMGTTFEYIGRAIPVAICILCVKEVVTSSIAISDRVKHNVALDIKKYIGLIIENICRLTTFVLSAVPLALSICKAALQGSLRLVLNIISTLLSGLYFIWNIVKEIRLLIATYKTMDILDKAFGLSTDKEKVALGLGEFHNLKKERDRAMEKALLKVAPGLVEKARSLMTIDTEECMKERFGAHSFKLLDQADKASSLDVKLQGLKDARALMRVKEVSHYLEIVASVAAATAGIFELVFPTFGLIALAGMGAWAVAGSGWVTNLILCLIMDKRTKDLMEKCNIEPKALTPQTV